MKWGIAEDVVNPLSSLPVKTGTTKSGTTEGCAPCEEDAKKVSLGGEIDCRQIDGKWYLFQELFHYDMPIIKHGACEADNVYGLKCTGSESKPFYPVSQTFKPALSGEQPVLPSFSGYIEVYVKGSSEPIRVHGEEPLPEGMIGVIACISGDLCYFGSPAQQPIPDEVWCGESEPTDPNVEVWISNGITKTKNPDGKWVQTKAYGA